MISFFYDTKKGIWYEIISDEYNLMKPSKRHSHTGIFLKNKLYIYGGFEKYENYNILKNDLFLYDIEKNTWTQIFTMDDFYYLKTELINKEKHVLLYLELLVLKNMYRNYLVKLLNSSNSPKKNINLDEYNNISDQEKTLLSSPNVLECIKENDIINAKFKQKKKQNEINQNGIYKSNIIHINHSENLSQYSNNIYYDKKSPSLNCYNNNTFNNKPKDNNFVLHEFINSEENVKSVNESLNIHFDKNQMNNNIKEKQQQHKYFHHNFFYLKNLNNSENIIIPYNNFRNKCFYFKNSLYFYGGSGYNPNIKESIEKQQDYIFYDNVTQINTEVTYMDFILSYLIFNDTFFFKYIQKIQIEMLPFIQALEKNFDNRMNEQEKHLKEENIINKICVNIQRIQDKLNNIYMNKIQSDTKKEQYE